MGGCGTRNVGATASGSANINSRGTRVARSKANRGIGCRACLLCSNQIDLRVHPGCSALGRRPPQSTGLGKRRCRTRGLFGGWKRKSGWWQWPWHEHFPRSKSRWQQRKKPPIPRSVFGTSQPPPTPAVESGVRSDRTVRLRWCGNKDAACIPIEPRCQEYNLTANDSEELEGLLILSFGILRSSESR